MYRAHGYVSFPCHLSTGMHSSPPKIKSLSGEREAIGLPSGATEGASPSLRVWKVLPPFNLIYYRPLFLFYVLVGVSESLNRFGTHFLLAFVPCNFSATSKRGRNIVDEQLPALLDVTCCVRLHTLLLDVAASCWAKFEIGKTFNPVQTDATLLTSCPILLRRLHVALQVLLTGLMAMKVY